MCKIMEDTINEDRKETAKRMIKDIADGLALPLSTVEQLAQSMIKA